MSKLRSVNTRFWDDPFIVDLNPTEKLLFLYLLTNTLTNMIGIYEISIRRISFDTGLDSETVEKGLKRFESIKKAYFIDNYIVLPNWLKNQNLNPNMKKGAMKEFDELPNELKERLFSNGSEGLPKDYQTLSNGIGNLIESNRIEFNISKEQKEILFEIFFFKNFINPEKEVQNFIDHYSKTDWIDKNGNQIKNIFAAARRWEQKEKKKRRPEKLLQQWRGAYDIIKRKEFLSIDPIRIDNDTIVFKIPNKAVKDYLETNWLDEFKKGIRSVFGPGAKVAYEL